MKTGLFVFVIMIFAGSVALASSTASTERDASRTMELRREKVMP